MPTLLGPPGSAGDVLVQYEKQLSTGVVGSIWLGRLATGAEAGRLVTVRRIALEWLDASDIRRIEQTASAFASIRSPSLIKPLEVTRQDRDLLCISEHLVGIRLHGAKNW